MARLADNPQKRKGLLIVTICLIAGLVIVVGIGVTMHFAQLEKPHESNPVQTEAVEPASDQQ